MENFNLSFSHKIVDTLLTSNVILKDFKAYIGYFSPVRTPWNVDFADSMIQRSEVALSDLVGVDHRGELRDSTDRVVKIMDDAKADLYIFKVNVLVDFETAVAEEILTKLGYSRYYKEVVDKYDQESLMSLLNNFKNSMTEDMRKLVTGNGISSEHVDKIIGYAPAFQEANLTQEELKNHWNEPSIEGRHEIQAIYDETIRICKVGRTIFRDNQEMRNRFTFSKVMAKVSANRAGRKEEEDRETAEDEE
ncbi:MAG: hypothetical protein ACLFM7_12885 [Bacteroidales bacterium]